MGHRFRRAEPPARFQEEQVKAQGSKPKIIATPPLPTQFRFARSPFSPLLYESFLRFQSLSYLLISFLIPNAKRYQSFDTYSTGNVTNDKDTQAFL
jgi:hypothetical protein